MRCVKILGGMLAAALLTMSAQAAQLNWNLAGTFDDGGTISGTFVYDIDGDYISAFDVTTSTKGVFGMNYRHDVMGGISWYTPGDDDLNLSVSDFDLFVYDFTHMLRMTGLDFTVAGSYAVAGQESFRSCPNFWDCTTTSRTIVSAIATTGQLPPAGIPEASSWAMMLAGFTLAGATLRRRRRQPATA